MSPTSRLTDPVERGTARLLSACLLGMLLAFGALDAMLLEIQPEYIPPWQGYALLGLSYALSRTTHFRAGAVITTAMFPAVAIMLVIQGNAGDVGPLSFALLAPFFAGLFLGRAGALVFAIVTPTAIALTPVLSQVTFLEVTNHFLANVVGGLVAVSYTMHRDWMERRRSEANQLQEAQLIQMQKMEALGRMAGGIAHDFNNLLTVINGGVELLARNGAGKELRLIETATASAQTLTSQLLTLSRQRLIERGPSDVSISLDAIQRLLSRIIGEDIQVKVSVAEGTSPVALGENQLQQLLLNLSTNARDAMPEGGTLEFLAKNHDEHLVCLIVRDTGVGMDWETREKVFEPFFTTKSVGKGTGLGLSMVFGIVSQAGGSIEVESEPGRGATFQLFLPRAKSTAPTPVASERFLDLGGRARGSVLLVEDDSGVRELCRSVLRREGYEVLEAADAQEALTLHEHHSARIDLLISDIVMPKMSGLILAETLRARVPDLPVLFISGYAPDHVAGRPVDARLVLQKPFRPTELLRRVSAILYGLESQSPPPAEEMPTEANRIPPLRDLHFSEPGTSGFRLKGSENGDASGPRPTQSPPPRASRVPSSANEDNVLRSAPPHSASGAKGRSDRDSEGPLDKSSEG